MIMNEVKLNKMCAELMEIMWGEKLEIPVKINPRIKSTFGRLIVTILSSRDVNPKCIEISSELLNGKYKSSTVESVIKHELCHYYLCKIGKPYKDGHRVFETELKRIGSHSTRVIMSVIDNHECICNTCGSVVSRYSSENRAKKVIGKYISTCCKDELSYRYNPNLADETEEIATEYSVIDKYISGESEVNENDTKEIICANREVKLENIIVSKRGKVTQGAIFNAVKAAVDEKSISTLTEIKKQYPEIFNKVSKLMGKKRYQYIITNIA